MSKALKAAIKSAQQQVHIDMLKITDDVMRTAHDRGGLMLTPMQCLDELRDAALKLREAIESVKKERKAK